jgi:predicted nucleic acid-binding protein
LPFLGAQARAGGPLLLDTCVYIDQMQRQAPPLIEDLLALRIVNHSTIAIQELMHAVGALDPDDARSNRVVAAIGTAINAMMPHRVFAPDTEVLAEAAVYAGILGRLQGYARDDRMRALHDCVLFLQALKLGFCVLSRNVRDFDLLLQLRQEGRVLFYRT